jgi:hypothetical protein
MIISRFAVLMCLAMSSPVIAATTVLDFDAAQACAGVCADGVPVLATYGDTADVDVSYLVRSAAGNSSVVFSGMIWWGAGFSDLQGVVTGAQVSEIRLELLSAAKIITLNSFDMGRFTGAFETDLRVYDLDWNLLWTVTNQFAPISGTRLSYAPDVSAVGGLVIQHGPGSENRGLDNISFTISDLPAGPSVPEPASWAMLIAGFGLVGAAMRRRRLADAVVPAAAT